MRAKILVIPGVTAVGASTNLPWSGYDENTSFGIVGRTAEDDDDGPGARYQARRARLLRGRGDAADGGATLRSAPATRRSNRNTLIVNDALVSRYFPKRRRARREAARLRRRA